MLLLLKHSFVCWMRLHSNLFLAEIPKTQFAHRECWVVKPDRSPLLPTGEADAVPVLVLPWPVLFLVQSKLWTDLLLLIRWHGAFHTNIPGQLSGFLPLWPPPHASVWTAGKQVEVAGPSVPYSEPRALECLATIREHMHADNEEDLGFVSVLSVNKP